MEGKLGRMGASGGYAALTTLTLEDQSVFSKVSGRREPPLTEEASYRGHSSELKFVNHVAERVKRAFSQRCKRNQRAIGDATELLCELLSAK